MPLPSLNAPLTWKSADPSVAALLDNLQANILKGHGRNHTVNLFLSFDADKKDRIKAAIRQLSGQLKTAKQQLIEAEEFKASKKDGGTVRCFFMTFAGYKELGLEAIAPDGNAFRSGMKARSNVLNDTPENWDDNFKNNKIHAMLLLADEDTTRLKGEFDSVKDSLEAIGINILFEEHGDQQRNDRGHGVEHFGYVDGRSQPLLLTEDIASEKNMTDGVSMWDPSFPISQVLATKGDSLLGSYFVFRKLEQNVFAFKRKEQDLSFVLELTDEDRELAGAMVVGRFEDGTPVVLRKKAGIGGDAVPNNFNYDDDKQGLKCPFHSHIRKTNPREESKRAPIMARRGITYGEREEGMVDRPEKKVGLLFMSYQASLENQFEFTQQSWANSPNFPSQRAGIDPVIGQGTNPPNSQQMPPKWGNPEPDKKATEFKDFVTMKGGEYFFAPSITTLKNL
jgi:Dyp-type peroxidase family